MPLPKNRSNSVRKIARRTPKGRHTLRFKRVKKGKVNRCAVTGNKLQAIDSKPNVPKSSRRPNRKFGGTLSSAVSSRVLVLASRVKEGKMELKDVDVRFLSYVKGLVQKK